jgi:hypothetical protein
MSEPLPLGNYRWLSQQEIDNICIEKLGDEDPLGYVFCVDLEYPKDLHDSNSDYPLAVERFTVDKEMLSPHSRKILDELYKGTYKCTEKLVPNLFNKSEYVVHYRTLKLYIELGLKVLKIHKVVEFEQSRWLKKYVDFCTEKRLNSKNAFEKQLWKCAVNSQFGKMIEGVRNKIQVELVNKESRLLHLVKQPTFKSFKIFTPDLSVVHSKK